MVLFGIILAYLIGSISSATLLAKWAGFPDPRTQGSQSAGATNMARLAGKSAGLYVLLADGLKGLLAILIGYLLHIRGPGLSLLVLAVVLGHVFPIFFKFKGGKGTAPFVGAILGLSFWVAIFLIATWLLVAILSRYSSLASLVTAVGGPLYLLIAGLRVYFFPVLLAALVIIWKHRDNIQRLRTKTEPKLNLSNPKI